MYALGKEKLVFKLLNRVTEPVCGPSSNAGCRDGLSRAPDDYTT